MLENWGGMTKSQDNAQTIDEAIAFAIAEHEADPESHMGAGESIENHRVNDVIDHPAGSVLTDKSTTKEIVIQHNFMPLDYYNVNGGGTYEAHQENISSVQMYFEGSTSYLRITTSLPAYLSLPRSDKDCLFQFNAQATDGFVFIGYFGLFYKNTGDIEQGFGFKFINDEVYAFFRTSSGLVLSSALTVDITEINQFRIVYIASEKRCYFYINGTNVAVITSTGTVPSSSSVRPMFWGEPNGASTYINFILFDWFFSETL